jgi:hypothetical protein
MVDIIKHRHALPEFIEECKRRGTLALYRENVCAQASEMELRVMGEACALRIIACAIWRNNYTGITRQFRGRRAQLRNAVLAICGITRATLWRALQCAGIEAKDSSSSSAARANKPTNSKKEAQHEG